MKDIVKIFVVTSATFEITRYNETMQLETLTETVHFDGTLSEANATAKVKKAYATKDQIVIMKSVVTTRRTYTMPINDFKFYAKLTEIAEEGNPIVSV